MPHTGTFTLQSLRSLFQRSSASSFQVLSDLHLEVGQQYSSFNIPPVAPYLILAGDIGRLIDYDSYLGFIAHQCQQFNRVFLVLGNHEFYGLSFSAGLEKAQQLENEPILQGKLTLLHQARFDIPDSDLTILGCTLWSCVPEYAKEVVHMKIIDFQKIENWTIDTHNAAHDSDLSWLQQQVSDIQQQQQQQQNASRPEDPPARKILVVTHHAPSTKGTSSPQHAENPWSSAFGTEVIEAGDWAGIKVWVFGHTHFTTGFECRGIRVVSNQRGYVLPGSQDRKAKHQLEGGSFDVKKIVKIDSR